MAKDLPWFKWSPSKWDSGNIQMCSQASKGTFADLCSLYWTRLGELPYALAMQKLCKADAHALQELYEHQIFSVTDGQVRIDFLDEQLSEFDQASEKRRKAANKRWSDQKKTPDASALQVHMQSNAIKNRTEEKREEDIYSDTDFFESNAQAYMLLSGNFHDTEACAKIISNNGWPGISENEVKALIHHFIETQVELKKQDKADVRQHLRRWLNKQPVEKLRGWTKNILENHARRGKGQVQRPAANLPGNACQVPPDG